MATAQKSMAEWRQIAAQYKSVIAKFERVRANLLKRRRDATDSEKEVIDDRLKRNDRTRESIRLELETAEREINRLARGRSAAPAKPNAAKEARDLLKLMRESHVPDS
jgi:hypothetical protein